LQGHRCTWVAGPKADGLGLRALEANLMKREFELVATVQTLTPDAAVAQVVKMA